MGTIRFVAGTLCLAALISGCGNKSSGADGAPASSATIGMNNPGNDAAIVKSLKQLLADCGAKLDEKEGERFKTLSSCDKWSAWRDQKLTKVDATCLNVLEDPDVKARAAGLMCLAIFGDTFKTDKAQAARFVSLLEKEKAPSPLDGNWAYMATQIYSSAGAAEQLKALVMKPDTAYDVKLVVLAWWSNDAAYDVVKSYASSPDPKIQNGVVQAYSSQFEKHTDEACAYWAAHLETADKDANRHAVGHITGGWNGNNMHDTESDWYVTGGGGGPSLTGDKRCSAAQLEMAINATEKLAKTGKLDESFYVYGMGFLVKDKKSSPAIKAHATSALKTIVETPGGTQRGSALDKLYEADPSQRAYVLKFAKDPDLKYTVDRILKAPAKKK
jgi:hypothetical protein